MLIDEREGRRVAVEMGLTPIGTLGIFRQAKQANLIAVVKPAIERLQTELKFRLSQDLVTEFLRSVGEE